MVTLGGKVLVEAGWSDLCVHFHRAHPVAAAHCVESDLELTAGVPEGEFRLYKCKHNLWDIVTPMYVEGRHVGNVFSGQFFFEDESPDYELFRAQARTYGFDEDAYMAALERVPRLSPQTVEATMQFFAKLARILSNESYGRIRLARSGGAGDPDRVAPRSGGASRTPLRPLGTTVAGTGSPGRAGRVRVLACPTDRV